MSESSEQRKSSSYEKVHVVGVILGGKPPIDHSRSRSEGLSTIFKNETDSLQAKGSYIIVDERLDSTTAGYCEWMVGLMFSGSQGMEN